MGLARKNREESEKILEEKLKEQKEEREEKTKLQNELTARERTLREKEEELKRKKEEATDIEENYMSLSGSIEISDCIEQNPRLWWSIFERFYDPTTAIIR